MTSLAVLVSLLLLIPATQGASTTSTQSSTNATGSTTVATGNTTVATGSTTILSSSSMSTMNVTTNSSSTTDNTTMIMSSPTTTATTTTAMPDISHNTDLAMNVLSLTVSNDNTSDIQYLNVNSTRETLLSQLRTPFQPFSFSTELVQVNTTQMPAMYLLKVTFQQKNIINNTQTVDGQIRAALMNIGNMVDFNTPNSSLTFDKVSQFLNSTMNVCAAVNVCPADYTCIVDGCLKMCRDASCSSHGTCYVSVTANGTSAAMCQCNSEYDIEYMGDNCEYSRRGRLQIIAIIAGVLGAVILILIVVIIILCLKYNRTSAHSKYDVTTANYGNSAYDGSQQK